ncbi:hypothetical protein ACFSCX_14035 [Bacillus salitolerans]|uniref:DUF4129 domain-containing protein n=1 Tax=Bacillus salitolerans TaxID=1437434 RepID=A0ABW4LRE8_9BACI
MLTKQDWILFILFGLTNIFEIVSLFLLAGIIVVDLQPIPLLFVYLVPLLLVRWVQLKLGGIPYAFYMMVPLIQMVVLFLLGYDFLPILLVGIFVSWRIIVLSREPYLENQGVWLAVVLLSTFLLLLINREFLFQYVGWFVLLIIIYISIRIIIHLRKSQWVFVRRSYQYLFIYIFVSFVAILILYHSGLFLMNTFFPFIWQGVALLFSYPLSWIFSSISLEYSGYDDVEKGLKKLQQKPFEQAQQNLQSNMEMNVIYILVAAVVITIIVVMYIARKRLLGSIQDNANDIRLGDDEHGDKTSLFAPLKDLRKAFYSRAGKNEVRVHFQKLQVYLKKREKGRLGSETALEWFERIGLTDRDSKRVLEIYHIARYGTRILSDEEVQFLIQNIKEIKQKFPKKRS